MLNLFNMTLFRECFPADEGEDSVSHGDAEGLRHHAQVLLINYVCVLHQKLTTNYLQYMCLENIRQLNLAWKG